ncbi:MAG: 30S ribosomal protein S21 [Flammeovirgaceae bacterium]|nr:30S ribosomal protein S21 [Flammeovirgaceae bacterium]|tara:strand:+ start:2498 stop:2740 length:243 start_codon:yes stop_codon:yes gene_type:complete
MRKQVKVSVSLKQCRGNVEKMIRRFIKKTKKEKIVEQARENKYYTKPSDAKREKRRRALRARLREERKRQRAEERRNRKN